MNRRDFLKTSVAATGGAVLLGPAAAKDAASPEPLPTPLTRLPVPATPGLKRLPDLAPAQWIWFPCGRCLANTFILFRREINLSARPVRARGWIVADSRYRLEVNGQRIQWGPAPSDPRWAEADPLDLTDKLQAGANVLGAVVLFYGLGDGTWPVGKPGFLFHLEVEYPGGAKEKIVSDPTWHSLLCRAWQPGHYKRWFLRSLQEEFDARLYPAGWSTRDYRPDAAWLPAMILEGSPNKPALSTKFVEYALGFRNSPENCELRPRSVPMLDEPLIPVKRLAESLWVTWLRSPQEYFEFRSPNAFKGEPGEAASASGDGQWEVTLDGTRAAALTFELVEQVVGWPYFTIEAPAGTTIELMLQEGHQVGGPALLNTSGRDAWTRFICREGVNHFECFDFESLRWLQLHIREAKGRVVVSQVGVRRRIYPWPNPAVVKSSEPALQKLFDASVNTLNNSCQDTLVDGMGRERQQYSGDCGHQLNAIRFTFGETRSIARFLTVYSQGQSGEGFFLDCWPGYDRLARNTQRYLGLFHLGAILDHGVQFVFDSWHHYLYSGDLASLHENYPRLVQFANYLRTLLNRDGDNLLPVENIGMANVWMDYQAYGQQSGIEPPFSQRHKQCAFNLYVAAMLQHALAPICRAHHDEAQAVAVETFGRELQVTTVKRFWSPERRLFVNNLPWVAEEKKQTLCDRSLANAVLFDQCPGGDIVASVQTLADCPKEMGLSYPANAGWRLRALAKGRRADVIVKDYRTRWATMISVTENNTVQEAWKAAPDTGSQWSHCAVVPLYITQQHLAGIQPLVPGFARAEIYPQLADLDGLELHAYIPQGPIKFSAKGPQATRELTLSLPPGCEAELVLKPHEKITLARAAGPAPEGCVRYLLPAGQSVTVPLAGA